MLKEIDPNFSYENITEEIANYVITRDRGLCQLCGKVGAEIHHIIFKSKMGDNKPNNLTLLCKECHTGQFGVHGISNKNIAKRLFERVLRNEKLFRERLTS